MKKLFHNILSRYSAERVSMPPKLHQLQKVVAHEGSVTTMALGQHTGKVFATGGEDQYLFLWSIGSNNPRASFGPFPSPISICAFSSDEEKIICGSDGGTVMLYDLSENRAIANWAAHRSAVRGIAFHPEDEKIAVSCGYDGRLQVLSTQQKRPLQSHNACQGPANSVSLSGDGRYAAVCGDDKTVRVFDLTSQRQLVKFTGHSDAVKCVRFHPSEPLLISSSVDRSIRFWDLTTLKEIPVSFPLDSSPVELVKFTETEAFSLSSDYLKVVGWNPPELFDHFTVGLERVHDLVFMDETITIASSSADRAIIHRMRTDTLKPFCNRPTNQQEETNKKGNRLLDLQVIRQVSARRRMLPPGTTSQKTDSTNVKKSESADSHLVDEEGNILREFRKHRGAFMSSMNEKFSRVTRLNDMLDQQGLTRTLAHSAETGELGAEILMILRMKPEAVKLEHSCLVMQIAVHVFDTDHDLAISTVESMLQAFGKLVHATRSMPLQGVGVDVALEARKKKCDLFVEAFRQIAPRLRTVASGQSTSAQTAAEILDEWRIFLR